METTLRFLLAAFNSGMNDRMVVSSSHPNLQSVSRSAVVAFDSNKRTLLLLLDHIQSLNNSVHFVSGISQFRDGATTASSNHFAAAIASAFRLLS